MGPLPPLWRGRLWPSCGGGRTPGAQERAALPPPAGPRPSRPPSPVPGGRGWPRQQGLWFPGVRLLAAASQPLLTRPLERLLWTEASRAPPGGLVRRASSRMRLVPQPLGSPSCSGPGRVRENWSPAPAPRGTEPGEGAGREGGRGAGGGAWPSGTVGTMLLASQARRLGAPASLLGEVP